MQSGLLARTLSGRLATKLSRPCTCQITGFATKEAAAAGVPDREKETKLQTLLKVTSCHLSMVHQSAKDTSPARWQRHCADIWWEGLRHKF